jgi:hypothetical protein
MPIPQDLHDFLSKPDNRRLILREGEVRDLTFFAPEELKLQKFIVDSFELHLNGPLAVDPKEQREYEGYSLIKTCKSYSPDGVFVWFPKFTAYGQADPDHRRIIIYPNVTWTEIVRDPTWYINGEWYPDRVAHEVVNPWL